MEQHTMDIIVAGTWFAILIYAVIANILLAILIVSSTETRTLTSYWIVGSFSLSEVGMAMTALFHVVPFVLLHEAFSKNESTSDFLMLSGYHSFWAVSLMHLVLMALNRLAIRYTFSCR
ncbi:unnamed protein product [Cylicostephanus goldi]|uniref:G-protein coupled receptors family 1 profile domain-containing protein n=1 Tax=Cylicostephanus goldi TaxID=71465 RepID=A0A3P7M7T5_CYLGO|nr:unnamed protein product [Cylicostephanus goldi]